MEIARFDSQFHDVIFNGKLAANKPVFDNGKSATKPYSNFMYWSHSRAIDDCEFGMHPHKGLEIMTFILEGQNDHYDSQSHLWFTLHAGDFQIIASNSGILHSERLKKGTRAFQLWFDPDFYKHIKLDAMYKDYKEIDIPRKRLNDVTIIDYVGKNGVAVANTPHLDISRYLIQGHFEIPLEANQIIHLYVVNGAVDIDSVEIGSNDCVKIKGPHSVQMTSMAGCDIFAVKTMEPLEYIPIWEK